VRVHTTELGLLRDEINILVIGSIFREDGENTDLIQRIKEAKQSIPITGLDRPLGFQEVEAPRFQGSRHMKVVRLSALGTGRLYTPRKYFWYSFQLESMSTPGP
jgi:hypothetical protein